MSVQGEVHLPVGFDWQHWIERWDRMQDRYLFARAERFDIMTRMIGATQPDVRRILDLGCGPGSLTLRMLEAFPQAQVIGLDFDPAILALAQVRLSRFGERALMLRADLRSPDWSNWTSEPCDAVVSATALHWLDAEQLEHVYPRVAQMLQPGGIFLNADHVGSDSPRVQDEWDRERTEWITQHDNPSIDEWEVFWSAYRLALGLDLHNLQAGIEGNRSAGVDKGMSLAWHFHELKSSGFRIVDCFWRHAGDAVYGGIMGGNRVSPLYKSQAVSTLPNI